MKLRGTATKKRARGKEERKSESPPEVSPDNQAVACSTPMKFLWRSLECIPCTSPRNTDQSSKERGAAHHVEQQRSLSMALGHISRLATKQSSDKQMLLNACKSVASKNTLASHLEPYLQPAVASRCLQVNSALTLEYLSELHILTSIFVRLPKLTEQAKLNKLDISTLRQTFSIVSTATMKAEGTLNQFLYDDKGFVGKIFFQQSGGVDSFETSELKAVLCALDIQSGLSNYGKPP